MMTTNFFEPTFEDWFTADRKQVLYDLLGNSIPLLISSGTLNVVVKQWVKENLDLSSCSNKSKNSNLSWARQQWGHRLKNLFQKRKDDLDQVRCRLLRISDHGLSLELYHRLLANESSFENLSTQYGEGPEKMRGGVLPLQSISKLPEGLGKVVCKLQPGEVSFPLRSGKWFVILRLEEFKLAVINSESENQLLDLEFEDWLQYISDRISSDLTSGHLS